MAKPNQSSNDIIHATIELKQKWPKIKTIWEAHFPGWKAKLGTVYRSPEDQFIAFKKGASQIDGFKKIGKHNKYPSEAIDVNFYSPQGIWIVTLLESKKITREQFNGMYAVLGLLGHIHELRWGNDWNRNLIPVTPDPLESFVDAYHLETL
jgi:hypothetical protein